MKCIDYTKSAKNGSKVYKLKTDRLPERRYSYLKKGWDQYKCDSDECDKDT